MSLFDTNCPIDALKWENGGFFVKTDPTLLDLKRIHAFLSASYWATGIPKDLVAKSIEHSLCFGIYLSSGLQIGFARTITDRATFAYLADVYLEREWRGKGISKWLLTSTILHPKLQGLRRFCKGTRDAHNLYRKFGFENSKKPENWMEIKLSGAYQKPNL
jgi:N-acetylglutamate synthase-like GNAT family acetyltransferase